MEKNAMSPEQIEHLETLIGEKVDESVTRALDARQRKLFLSVWTMIVGGLGSLIFLGVQWGTLKTKVETNAAGDKDHHSDKSLHMPAADKYSTFITRTEWVTLMRERDKSYDELKAEISENNKKIDRLVEQIARLPSLNR